MGKTVAHLNSPYGLLRSPWNYNPSPFVTRFGNVFRINDTNVIGSRDLVFKYHMGVHCIDYENFFKRVKGEPLSTYLTAIEDDTHGIFHFTLGGIGGDSVVAATEILMKDYGFSWSNIAALSVSAQPFFKTNLAVVSTEAPVNCTDDPWQNNMLMTGPESTLGSSDGPQCEFNYTFYKDEESLDLLITKFFTVDPVQDDSVSDHLATLSFEERSQVMKIIANMFPVDGDLAGAGAGKENNSVFSVFNNSQKCDPTYSNISTLHPMFNTILCFSFPHSLIT